MAITWLWIMFVIAIIVIVISFIMSPESKSFSGALVGSSDLDLFKESKERGSKKVIKYSMFTFGILLMVVAIIIRSVM